MVKNELDKCIKATSIAIDLGSGQALLSTSGYRVSNDIGNLDSRDGLIISDADVYDVRIDMLRDLANPCEQYVRMYFYKIVSSPRRDLDDLFLSLILSCQNPDFEKYALMLKSILGNMDNRSYTVSYYLLITECEELRHSIDIGLYDKVGTIIDRILDFGTNDQDLLPACFNVSMESAELLSNTTEYERIIQKIISYKEYRREDYLVRMILSVSRCRPHNNDLLNDLESTASTNPDILSLVANIHPDMPKEVASLLNWLSFGEKYGGACILEIYMRIHDSLDRSIEKSYGQWIRKVLMQYDSTKIQEMISIFRW